jgi:hypothetical protein
MITDLKLQPFHRPRNHDHILPWSPRKTVVVLPEASCLPELALISTFQRHKGHNLGLHGI